MEAYGRDHLHEAGAGLIMKIGLSLSRCVRDIVEGRVDINDVLVIIARTNFDPTNEDHWKEIWAGYCGSSPFSNPEWAGLDHDATRAVVMDLWHRGLIHQPRKFGAMPIRRPEFWLETVMVEKDLENNVAAKAAWEQFQVLAQLCNVGIDKEYR